MNLLVGSALATAASVAGLQWWVFSLIDGIKADGLIADDNRGGVGIINSENFGRVLEWVLASRVTIALLINLAVNVYLLIVLCLKTLFFEQLYPSETRKLLERLINYVIYRGMFLLLVVPPSGYQTAMWLTWLTVLCTLKIFQSLAKDRLERLNASPSTTPSKYLLVFTSLLLVLSADLLWMKLCRTRNNSFGPDLHLLLFFEPLSIALETLQAIIIHGFQLFEIWQRHSVENGIDMFGFQAFNKTAAVARSLSELKGVVIRNCCFFLDIVTLLTTLGHYLTIWWLHGMAFHFVDVLLFTNLRTLGGAILKRIRGYIKLRKALTSLNGALPDATYEDLCSYDDECAICRGPMAKAKKLSCNHLFHLACLRSWLDQGLMEVNSCPTCRRPLFPQSRQESTDSVAGEASSNEQASQQNNLRQETLPGHPGAFPGHQQNLFDSAWRGGGGLDSVFMPPWSNQGATDAASTSDSTRSASLSGVQMMMRQLASASENYSRLSLEDSPWNLWPSSRASDIASSSIRSIRNEGSLRFRNPPSSNGDMPTMVDRVREVLPHIPNELIVQDLQRTNNINITVNNLLQLQ